MNWADAVWLLLILALAEALVVLAIVVVEPSYIASPLFEHAFSETGDRFASASEASRQIHGMAKSLLVQRGREFFVGNAQICVIWGIFGLLFGRGRRAGAIFVGTFCVVAGAQLSSSVEFILRYLQPIVLNTDLGPITIGATLRGLGLPVEGRVNVFSWFLLWWAYIAGSGFSVLWQRPRRVTIAAAVAVVAVWILMPFHLHS